MDISEDIAILRRKFRQSVASSLSDFGLLGYGLASSTPPAVLAAMKTGQALLMTKYTMLAADAALRLRDGMPEHKPDPVAPEIGFTNEMEVLDAQSLYAALRTAENTANGPDLGLAAQKLPQLKTGFEKAVEMFSDYPQMAKNVQMVAGYYIVRLAAPENRA